MRFRFRLTNRRASGPPPVEGVAAEPMRRLRSWNSGCLPTIDVEPLGDPRNVLNGLFWQLNTGTPWRALPTRSGLRQTIDDRQVVWQRDDA